MNIAVTIVLYLLQKSDVAPFEEDEDIREYLMKKGYDGDVTWDWTNFYFERESDKETLSKKEVITTHISYVSLYESEGWEAEVV